MLVAILFVCVALCGAQQPKPCSSPGMFEGRRYVVEYDKGRSIYAKISYDEYNQRVRLMDEVLEGDTRVYYDILRLYQERKEYVVSLGNDTCVMRNLTKPFVPFGVPTGATYEGTASIGPVNIPNEHVTTIRYKGNTSEGVPYAGTVSSPSCMPINSENYFEGLGFVRQYFFDLSEGIPDPSVFNIPPQCQQ